VICLKVDLWIKPGNEEQAKHYMQVMEDHTRKEPGNRAYIAYQSATDPRRFMFYEVYDNEAALQAHRDSEHFRRYVTNGLAQVIERREHDIYRAISE
jgi:quinol monooxygenase YgiN